LLNLVINARDALPGGGWLSIETVNTTLDDHYCENNPDIEPGDYVQLTVSDCGEGMTAEQLEHIFEPFYTTKEQGKGTGLGLSMCLALSNALKVMSMLNLNRVLVRHSGFTCQGQMK
jgi:signal transduction histidine kinase